MDPDATLREINGLLLMKDYYARTYLACQLHEWILCGGYEPNWEAYPKASEYMVRRYPHTKFNNKVSFLPKEPDSE